jgi:hypothetical protein
MEALEWEAAWWQLSQEWQRSAELPGFKCIHCRNQVAGESWRSGVVNRNHCPYCLHSRHLDLLRPGDRLAACKEAMAPIGLTLKRTRKKYGFDRGELMLIHLCRACGKLSLNRIAADDDNERLLVVFQASLAMDARLRIRLRSEDIDLLAEADRPRVESQLFGLEVVIR